MEVREWRLASRPGKKQTVPSHRARDDFGLFMTHLNRWRILQHCLRCYFKRGTGKMVRLNTNTRGNIHYAKAFVGLAECRMRHRCAVQGSVECFAVHCYLMPSCLLGGYELGKSFAQAPPELSACVEQNPVEKGVHEKRIVRIGGLTW
jgi:hypothetical protein